MWRIVGILAALSASAAAQPAGSPGTLAPGTAAITAEPAPPSSTPPVAYPPPTTAPIYPPGYAPAYEPPRARPDRFVVALGLVVGGGGPSNWLYGAWTGELGVTLLPDPLRVRARLFGVLAGGTIESDWGGDFSRVGGGLEGRWCTAGTGTCLFADLDLGYQKLTLADQNSEFVRSDKGAIAGPRFGVDFGGSVRFRLALELYRHFAHHATRRDTSYDAFGTLGLSFAVGYQH